MVRALNVMFAGNLQPQYGALTPAFMGALANMGVVSSVAYEAHDCPGVMLADTYLGSPLKVHSTSGIRSGAYPDLVHLASPLSATVIDALKRTFPQAKFIASFDGVTDPSDSMRGAIEASDAIVVSHAESFLDAYSKRGDPIIAGLMDDHEARGTLFSVKPGIDTAVFDPSTDPLLEVRSEFSRYSVFCNFHSSQNRIRLGCGLDVNNPSGKKFARSQLNYLFGLHDSRDVFTYLYGPDLSLKENADDVVAGKFVPLVEHIGSSDIFFTGAMESMPKAVEDYDAKVFAHRHRKHVAFVSGSDAHRYHLMLAGAYVGIFPPEANSPDYVSTQYAQRAMEAMRYGVILATSAAFERQGIVKRHDADNLGGNALVAKDNSVEGFDGAMSATWKHVFYYIDGNGRYSPVVANAMDMPCSVEETAKGFRKIYDSLLCR